MTFRSSTILIILVSLALPLGSSAQATHADDSAFHHHHLSFFTGGTTALGEAHPFSSSATWFTTGLDYEYKIAKSFGISVFAEYLFATHEEFLFGLPVFVHPYRGLKFNASPLLALVNEATANESKGGWHTKYGFRIEGGYDLLIGHYTITPIINFDRVEGHNELNYGIAVGMGF